MSERSLGWSREFEEPIALPGGGKLVVFRDAANYTTALPANEAALPEWQAAIVLVVELGGPTMFARIGVMRALNRGHVREFNPSGKQHHWGGEGSRGTNDGLDIRRHQQAGWRQGSPKGLLPATTPLRHGSRRTTRKAWRLSMRIWSDDRPMKPNSLPAKRLHGLVAVLLLWAVAGAI